jgi:mannose-6-phosphate isomerase-like protein (cupin superfamily)
MVTVNVDAVPVITTETGTQLRVLMDTTEGGQGHLSLAMESLGPGQHTTPHYHTDLEEIYYVVTGTGTMQIGAETRPVRAGDAILIPLHEVHCLRNTGDVTLDLLCPTSPPWCADDYRIEEKAYG